VTDVAELADQISWPDFDAATQAHDALIHRADIGRLAGLIEWLAGVQGEFPIREIRRPRVVLVVADHEQADTGASRLTPADTARTIAAVADATAPVARLASRDGVGIRVEQVDAGDSAAAAFLRGAAIADAEVDAGTDLIIVGNVGAGSTTTAAAIVSLLAGVEPIKAIGRGGSRIDDTGWMHKISAIRDARHLGRPLRDDLGALLTALGAADIAVLTGLLLGAAARRTPVLIDGVVAAAAALVADEAKPGLRRWWRAAQRTGEPALDVVLRLFDLTPVLDLEMAAGDGRGGLLALELLRSALVISAAPSAPMTSAAPSAPMTSAAPSADV
jgi:nicotinate-nucleotide--dimethylbenzimidazole phosphoribosyltransferase